MNVPDRAARGRIREPGRMNGVERRYAEVLEGRRVAGELLWWKYEAIALRLAEPKCFYHPDFMVMLADGSLEVHETKGEFIREDGWLKLKIAASMYPFVFRKCVWSKGAWEITVVGRADEKPANVRIEQKPEKAQKPRETPKSPEIAKLYNSASQVREQTVLLTKSPQNDANGNMFTNRNPADRKRYTGGPIPEGMAVMDGYLVTRSEAISMISPKRSA